PLVFWWRRFFARRSALPGGGHFHQFAQAALVIFENHITLYEVLQLAQISRPGIVHGRIQQMLGWRLPGLPVFFAVLLEEMLKQQRNFRRAFPKRGHVDGQYIRSEERRVGKEYTHRG